LAIKVVKMIADLVRSSGMSEFHVALTQSLWWYGRWCLPIVGAPSDVEFGFGSIAKNNKSKVFEFNIFLLIR